MLTTLNLRPRRALAAGGWCRCACHDTAEADLQADAQHRGAPVARYRTADGLGTVCVAVARVDEAAAACDACRDEHTPALSGRPPELAPTFGRRRYAPPALVAVPQADGGEGAEG